MYRNKLRQFQQAQDSGFPSVFDDAIGELKSGKKIGHWIWFVLPQLRGLGHSEMAQCYGVHGMEEAKAYLTEPTLRLRLEEVIAVISDQLQKPDQSLEVLMGSSLDAAKTISCLTLFEAAGLTSASVVLNRLGRRCTKTQALLSAPATPPPA